MRVGILYWTKTGHTERAARVVADAVTAAGAEASLIDLRQDRAPDLSSFDAVVVGSPCHAGSMKFMGSGVAAPVARALAALPSGSLAGKRGAAFSVNAGYGGARTIASIERILRDAGATVAFSGPVVKAGTPLSLVVGPMASESDNQALRRFGQEVAAAGDA